MLSEDHRWYITDEKFDLSEDGFCGNCDEFYSDCSCFAYWIRHYKKEVNRNKSLKKEIEKLKKCKELNNE